MKSAAVSAIIRCSSVKSSGVNTSSGRRSSIRKLPPRAATTEATSGACALWVAIPSPFLDPLENSRGAHATAHTHGHQSVAALPALQLTQDLGGELGAGAAQGMAKGDRAAVDVDL